MRVPVGRQAVDHGAAGISETEELRNLVVGLARRIVASPASRRIQSVADFEQVRVASANHQRERRQFHRVLRDDRVNVPFNMIHCDQREPARHSERLRVCDPNQQGSDESGPLRDGDRREVFEPRSRLFERETDGGTGPQMLARSKLRDDAP